jgi:hypothetical protein
MRTGSGFLAIWSDIRPDEETDYLHWLSREHTEERVGIAGFLGVRVFRARLADVSRYFILYSLEDGAVMGSPAYLERLNAPTPWSTRIMPRLGNFMRGGGTVTARQGKGRGAVVSPILLDAAAIDAARARLGAIVGEDRVIAAGLLQVDTAGTTIRTNEKTLRAGDRTFDALLLIEALDAEALTAAAKQPVTVFDQVFALDRADIGLS